MVMSAVFALAVGVLQFYMLSVVMKAALNKGWLKTALFAVCKLLLYFVGIFLAIKILRAFLLALCIGFGVGFGASMIIYAIKSFSDLKS